MHGIAINVDYRSLSEFNGIIPCGLVGRQVGCINDFLPPPVDDDEGGGERRKNITVAEFASYMQDALERTFQIKLVE